MGCFRVIPALGLDDLAAAQAGGTNAHALGSGANLGVDRAQVDVPASLAHVVGVTDRVPAHRLLAANLTNLCHRTALQNLSELGVQNTDCTGFERVSTMAQRSCHQSERPRFLGAIQIELLLTGRLSLRSLPQNPRSNEELVPCSHYTTGPRRR